MSKEMKSYFMGGIIFILFAMLRNFIPLHNMMFYVLACVCAVAAGMAAYLFLRRREKPMKEWPFGIAAVAGITFWMLLFFVNETKAEHPLDAEALLRSRFPLPLWLLVMAAGTAVCLFFMRKRQTKTAGKAKTILRAAVSLLFTAAVSVQFYAPNIFQDIQGGTYHSHAYTNSIINVCWMIPYSEHMETLYGHYAILYMPFLKLMHRLFHIDYLTGLFIVSAAIAGISVLLFLYVLNYFAKNEIIFYLGMFAIGEEYFMLMQGGVFLQVHPHRMIFPILLTVLVLQEHKTGKKYNIPAIIVLTLSTVWSTEVGIVTMLSFALYRWVISVMDGENFSVKKGLLLFRELLLYVLLPFFLSYAVVNGYNLLAKGPLLNMREFLYPLLSDRDYIEQIELPLPDATHAYAGASVLFLGAVFPALFAVFFPDGKEKKKKPFFFFLGIMCLGLMLYYVNRPSEGCIFITLFLMLILQAEIWEKSQESYLKWKEEETEKKLLIRKPQQLLALFLRAVTVFILFFMAFDSIYSIPGSFKTASETIWKRDELMEFAEYVYVQVPPDAVAFGEGVPELMSLIDRDTHLHTTEWSYLNTPVKTMEKVRYDLEKEPWFFCSLSSLWYMQTEFPGLSDQFYLHEVFRYNDDEFGFFRKEE